MANQQQGALYWATPESDEDKPLEPGELFIYRTWQGTRGPVIAKVLKRHPMDIGIQIHRYTHDPGPDPRIVFNPKLLLSKRRVAPEYIFKNKKGNLKHIGTFQPKPGWEAGTVNLDPYDLGQRITIYARGFKLSNGFVPKNVLDNLRRQYGDEFQV